MVKWLNGNKGKFCIVRKYVGERMEEKVVRGGRGSIRKKILYNVLSWIR